MAARSNLRNRLEHGAALAVRAGLRPLPMSAARACGRALGHLAWHADRRHRAIALDNLAHAFPARSERERRAVARDMFRHFGAFAVELLRFSAVPDAEALARADVEGEEFLRQAYAQGRGVLLVTGHFGYWEMQSVVLGLRTPRPMSVLARPLDNPYLHDMLERIRTRSGAQVIYRQGAVRRILRELGANNGVAILIDQHLHSDAVMVDFFGRPAATTTAVAALALRTGAAVVPAFSLPLPGGRYRFVYERPVPAPEADTPDAIGVFTQRCTDVLEMWVRRHPHLWLWMHRRWRTLPGAAEAAVAARVAGEPVE
jgi:KDO2-lipid IV(A) lauroyltransferase